jgi:hypothetical protein
MERSRYALIMPGISKEVIVFHENLPG